MHHQLAQTMEGSATHVKKREAESDEQPILARRNVCRITDTHEIHLRDSEGDPTKWDYRMHGQMDRGRRDDGGRALNV